MRIETLSVGGFGALRDRRLDLAPGLNVIFGPNEAGKSTWNQALYAALCGLRRGRGQTRAEREFEARHRPWDGTDWWVSSILRLEDGRRIELRQDLGGRVESQATDLDSGRDVRAEIVFEGSPDASRWLGLDRHAFLATACVRQADVLGVAAEPELLAEHLQRAAATAGTDATATAALARLEDFRRQRVGRDRAGSGRPLRQARESVERARERLDRARAAHEEYLSRARRREELEREAAAAEAAAATAAAVAAADRAAQLESSPGGAPGSARWPLIAAVVTAPVGLLLAVRGWPGPAAVLGLLLLGAAALVLAGRLGATRRRREPRRPAGASAGLASQLELARAEAARLARAAPPDALRSRGGRVPTAEEVEAMRGTVTSLQERAASARGAIEQFARQVPSVAEAEEALNRAEGELKRLRELDRILDLTAGFLQRAQEEVHRDIAPSLARSLRERLPRITGGRYLDALVDPASLEVRVCGQRRVWREASLLSQGTREQIHLLLRLALVEHLIRPGERSPILLDEITVHADESRTAALLGLLQELARNSQVVLFTQELRVAEWAASHLDGDGDRFLSLPGPIGEA
ncbi:MAG TPA: AAA family ATPase [Candidatus Dormibacteraeota bacterium]|nr:AAA family ATPase [Candidatus Dormibacteraeota bacterium]